MVDFKTPDSGELARNLVENVSLLNARDQVKFVICSRADYEWACEFMRQHALADKCTVWFSASHEQLEHRQLADWMIADRLPARFQMQLHKLLWEDRPGH